MKEFLNSVRKPVRTTPFSKQFLFSCLFLAIGLLVGIAIKRLDIYTQNLGNIFSQMSVWIFLCTVISVGSHSPKRASINVFLFSVGMLITYYLTAELTQSVYSSTFIYGWAIFSLFTPLFAFLAWYAKGKGWFSKLLSCGILLFMLFCAIIIFDKLRFSDIVLILLTGLYLFFAKSAPKK